MKKLQDFNLQGKNVLVRCDFNVPVSFDGEVLDDFRIKSVLPTINYLIKKRARVILMGHLERKGKAYSFNCLIPELNKLLGRKVFLFSDYFKKDSRDFLARKVNFGEVALLENLRFHKEEKENDKDFAKSLASLGDIYVNNAFSVCHRAHASIVAITEFLPSTAGFLLKKELDNLSALFRHPERPFVIIIGGVKLKAKGKAIISALEIADFVILGSKMEELLLFQKGILKNRNLPKFDFLKKIDVDNKKLIHPIDGVFAFKKTKDNLREGYIETLKENEAIFDVGPKSLNRFKEVIGKAKTILWSGAMGMYEDERFKHGTEKLAKVIKNNELSFNVAGGGETVSFIKNFNLEKGFDFLSTGGSAMLGLLNREELPGIKALDYRYGD